MAWQAIAKVGGCVGAGVGLFALQGAMNRRSNRLRFMYGPGPKRVRLAGGNALCLAKRLVVAAEIGVITLGILSLLPEKWSTAGSQLIPLGSGLAKLSTATVVTVGAASVFAVATLVDGTYHTATTRTTPKLTWNLHTFDEYAPPLAAIGLALVGGVMAGRQNWNGLALAAVGVGGTAAYLAVYPIHRRWMPKEEI